VALGSSHSSSLSESAQPKQQQQQQQQQQAFDGKKCKVIAVGAAALLKLL
jgi:hypothetical protein